MIEAKIIEGTLKEEYKSGVDWDKLTRFEGGAARGKGDEILKGVFGSIADAPPSLLSVPEKTTEMIRIGIEGHSLTPILHFMESCVRVRTLSSPWSHRAQPSDSMHESRRGFCLFHNYGHAPIYEHNAGAIGHIGHDQQNATQHPCRFIMNVHPATDEDSGNIIINLCPTISRLISIKKDPGVQILNQSLQNPSPHV